MSINITKKTGTTNTTSSVGRKILYIVVHYTAGVTSKAGAAANVASWFAQSAAQASADYIVDDDTIVQYNPDPANRYCWAVGGSKNSTKGGSLYGVAKNANSISVEICSTNSAGRVTNANDSYWSFTDAVLNKAVELVQYLMDLYGIDADHVIRHYDVNGKLCPGIVGWNADSGSETKWTAFKARLGTSDATTSASASASDDTTVMYRVRKSWGTTMDGQIGAFHDLDKAKACADANPGYSVFDEDGNAVYTTTSSEEYKVQVGSFKIKSNATALLIRLQNKDFDGFVYQGDDGEYKVQAGSFSSKENAEALVTKLKAAGFADAFVK